MSYPLPGFLIVLSTFMHCGPPDGVLGVVGNVMAPRPRPIRSMRAAARRTHPPRARPLSCVEKKGTFNTSQSTSPDTVPTKRSLQNCTAPKRNAGGLARRHLTQCALPFVPSTLDGGMGRSTFILKRVGQSCPPSLFRKCATSTYTQALPQRLRELSRQGANKMSWRHCSLQDRVWQPLVRGSQT